MSNASQGSEYRKRAAHTFKPRARGGLVMPNPSLEPTHYGKRRLAAPGPVGYSPYAASRRLPPRSSQLER